MPALPSLSLPEESPDAYAFVNNSMNWRDARSFCQAHHTNLAFVRNSLENGRIAALLPADAWIGLYRVSWKKWADQKRVAFTDWGEGQPDSKASASCGAVDAATATWWDDDCSSKRPFVCYTIQKTQKARVKLKFLSEADLMDPAVNQQILEQVEMQNTPPEIIWCRVSAWRLGWEAKCVFNVVSDSYVGNWPTSYQSLKSSGRRRTEKSFTRKRKRDKGGVFSLALDRKGVREANNVDLPPPKKAF